ncbi:VRR-NUC domain-containing protein [Pseudomonas sp. Marseille-QA0892]
MKVYPGATGARRTVVDYEGKEQAALFRWLQVRHPAAFDVTYHVPNGGHRAKAVAAKLKGQGVKAGVSDICMAQARGGFFGLYIEFKATPPHDSAVSTAQKAFLAQMEQQGYQALVCRGMNAAMAAIEQYLALPATKVAAQ